VKKFAHPDTTVRREAAIAVARVGRSAVDELLKLVHSPDQRVRSAALFAIGDLAFFKCPVEKLAPALTSVREALADKDDLCRMAGAYAVGVLADGDAQTIKALVTLLKDKDAGVRFASAEALGRLGPKAKDAVPVLQAAQGDPDADVRQSADEAVKKITATPPGGK